MQLVIGIICMSMIANLQYGWTLFVEPINDKYHWGRPAIQVAFTIFVVTETWLVPIEGWFFDKFGPRSSCSSADSVRSRLGDELHRRQPDPSLCVRGHWRIGAGAVYGTCVGSALKWFPDRRGLAAGLTAAGFGAGSALTIVPIASMIKNAGYQQTFWWFGLLQGGVVLLLALFLLRRRKANLPKVASKGVVQSRRNYGPAKWPRPRCSGSCT